MIVLKDLKDSHNVGELPSPRWTGEGLSAAPSDWTVNLKVLHMRV